MEEIEEADSIPELQSHVLAANKYLEEQFDDEDLRFSSDEGVIDDRFDVLARWIDTIQERMDEIAAESNIENYSITVGGSITGPSVSVSVTCNAGSIQ